MARMGRPPVPNSIREMMGSHHRRPNVPEPKIAGVVRCPKALSPEVRKVWKRLARILTPIGLLSVADQDLFGQLCIAIDRSARAQRELAAYGEVLNVKGKPTANPWLRIASESEKSIVRLAAEFGLSPSARSGIFASLLPPPAPAAAPSNDERDNSRFFADNDEFFEDEIENPSKVVV